MSVNKLKLTIYERQHIKESKLVDDYVNHFAKVINNSYMLELYLNIDEYPEITKEI